MDHPPPPPAPPDPPDAVSSTFGKRRHLVDSETIEVVSKKPILDKDMAVAAIQTLFIHPSLMEGIRSYSDLEKGPFLVHVSRSEPDPSAGTSIRPIKFGQLLTKYKISNISRDGLKKVGRNKISVEFTSGEAANKFLSNPVLGTKYLATIPSYNITKMGIVRQVPVDMSMDELVESVILPDGCGIILKARRLNRKHIQDGKTSWIPTQTVVITFKGQILPQRVYLFHTSLPVEAYQYPTIQCQNCCRFGHVKSQCRSKARCFRCSQPHTGDSCDVVEAKATCIHCLGRHFAFFGSCPEQGRQKSIKLLMSQENLSYEEASRSVPSVKKLYSEVTLNLPSQSSYSSSQSSSLSPPSSYKKTVFSSPKPRAPLGKSYDKAAHRSIIAEDPSSFPNGFSLLSQNSSPKSPQEDNLLELLLSVIISLVSRNNSSLPPHVAHKLSFILSNFNNGPSLDTSMEHSKH